MDWVTVRSMVLAVGSLSLAAGCSAAGPVSTPGSEGNEQPKTGGVLNVQVAGDLPDWDITYGGQSNAPALRLVYDSLLGFKKQPEVPFYELALQPRLAERWEISPDARTYTFFLRKGVKFANIAPVNGRALTATDVKWSYEYQARTGQLKDAKLPASGNAFNFEGMEAIETPDPYTVVVRFKEPFAPFLNYSAAPTNVIMPREIYEQDGHLRDRAIGTNAFQLAPGDSQKGTRWVFKKHGEYWQTGKPYIDEVRFIVLPSEAAAQAAFQTRQVDTLSTIGDPVVAQQIMKANPGAMQGAYQEAPRILYIQNQRSPTDDVRVRKAFSHSIDRAVFSRLWGGGEWDVVGVGVQMGVLPEEEVKRILRYDPEEAKRLLRDAGHPSGVDLEFLVAEEAEAIRVFELIQAQTKPAGINLVAKVSRSASADRRAGAYHIGLGGNLARPDIDGDLYGVFHSTAGNNHGKVKDAKLDSLVEAQRKEGDPRKRMEIVRDTVRYINENVFASTVARNMSFHHWHSWVKNYSQHLGDASGSLGPNGSLVDTWLDK